MMCIHDKHIIAVISLIQSKITNSYSTNSFFRPIMKQPSYIIQISLAHDLN